MVEAFDDLTLEDFARASGLTAEEIVRARGRGELFSCRIGHESFGRYPAYQLLDEIHGELLRTLISTFGPDGEASLYMFMRSTGDLLGGMSPVEVLCGRLLIKDESIPETVAEFLQRDRAEIVQGVLEAARSWLAIRRS